MIDGIHLAKILGPLMVMSAIWGLAKPKDMLKYVDSVKGNRSLLILGGWMAAFIGLAVITYHNVWEMSLAVLVTLYGWVALVKGVALFFVPGKWMGMVKSKGAMMFWGLLALVWGLGMCCYGYWS